MVVIEEVEVTPEKICGKCEKDLTAAGIKPQRCSRCKKIYYCSRDCQAKDWKFHKKDCKKQGTEKTEAKKNRTYDSAKGEDIGEIMTDHARFEKAFNTTKVCSLHWISIFFSSVPSHGFVHGVYVLDIFYVLPRVCMCISVSFFYLSSFYVSTHMRTLMLFLCLQESKGMDNIATLDAAFDLVRMCCTCSCVG